MTAPAASSPQALDHVENLSGCFNVTYRFAEDGVHDMFSEQYGLDEPIKEWIGFRQGDKDAFILQHVSIIGDRVDPHFHEVWRHHPDEKNWTQEVWSRSYKDEGRELIPICNQFSINSSSRHLLSI